MDPFGHAVTQFDGWLQDITPWIHRAADALVTQFDDTSGQFWRDTRERARVAKGGSRDRDYVTSTTRSFVALCEYERFLAETGGSISSAQPSAGTASRTRLTLRRVAKRFLAEQVTNYLTNEPLRAFTASHLAAALVIHHRLSGPLKLEPLPSGWLNVAEGVSFNKNIRYYFKEI